MSTATDRKAAKTAIVESQEDDPELEVKLANASRLQLDLGREENRHKEAINAQNLGIVGRWLGNGSNLPNIAALVAILFGGLLTVGLYTAAYAQPENGEVWSSSADRALAFALASLTYVFGKGQK